MRCLKYTAASIRNDRSFKMNGSIQNSEASALTETYQVERANQHYTCLSAQFHALQGKFNVNNTTTGGIE